ncbi:hypothetical protein NDU88_001218 [Pleurodeles waltl]|uniref:Uncharacterized protein n=1 Tax=Pleurodeles waltl TaxID=8319 RepID=A0AAV7R772_PLEWA|nr:hypothetical protein NDU88_001218 [Pleurodeles waltl]
MTLRPRAFDVSKEYIILHEWLLLHLGTLSRQDEPAALCCIRTSYPPGEAAGPDLASDLGEQEPGPWPDIFLWILQWRRGGADEKKPEESEGLSSAVWQRRRRHTKTYQCVPHRAAQSQQNTRWEQLYEDKSAAIKNKDFQAGEGETKDRCSAR